MPIARASKVSELTFRSGTVILGKEAIGEAAGWAGSELTGLITDNEQIKMIAGMASSMAAGGMSNKVDNYFNLSRKPFLSGMSVDDAARYNAYWDSLGNGTHTLPNMNAEDFARFQYGIDRLDAVYADRILAGSADDILKIRNAGDVVSNIDDYLNSSRKPFLSGMSVDDAARYNAYWDSLGNGTHTLPNMNAEDFARFQYGIDRLDAVYADKILADSADDILKIRNNTDSTFNLNKELINNPPNGILADIELKKISREALDKCHSAGLTDIEVENIRRIRQGDKPLPNTYLQEEFIVNHQQKFERSGCYKIISDKHGAPNGTIGVGQNDLFVLNGEDLDNLLKNSNGDPRLLEEQLAMPSGYLGDNPYIIRADNPNNLRMATGNEMNAWQDEWCPAGVTRGGVDEAIIDPLSVGDYSYKHCFDDDVWKN